MGASGPNRVRAGGNVPNMMSNQSGAIASQRVNVRGGRPNVSSNLYDFIRDTTDSEAIIQNFAHGPEAGGANQNLNVDPNIGSNNLDQTGLEVDTEIDFLDTQ